MAFLADEDIVRLETIFVTKPEFRELKQDITVLKEDVTVLKQDVVVLKQDVGGLKHDTRSLKYNLLDFKEEFLEFKDQMLTGHDKMIKLLEEMRMDRYSMGEQVGRHDRALEHHEHRLQVLESRPA